MNKSQTIVTRATSRRSFAFSVCLLAVLAASTGCHWSANGKNVAGTAMHQQGRYHEAISEFQEALARDPRNADAYYNMASSYHNLGKVTKDQQALVQAEQLYNQCLDIAPEHAECHRSLACLLVETERSDKAFTLLERWAQRSPQSSDARIELARLFQEFGDKQTAIQQLEQAVTISPNRPESARAWAALASLREQTGNYNQALADYSRSQQLNPFQPAVTERIAAIQRATGGALPANATVGPPTTIATVPAPVRY